MSALHLVRLPVAPREFTAWALDHHYLSTPPGRGRGRPREADLGYALHAVLTGLFGSQSPRPFSIPMVGQQRRTTLADRSTGRHARLDLLAYARSPLERLVTLAQLADPDLQSLIDWESARSRPMPARWPENLRLRFELRACPVRRTMKPLTTVSHPGIPAAEIPKGREVDAYQLAAARAREGGATMPRRDQVYVDWLDQRLAPRIGQPQAVSLVDGSTRVGAYRSLRLLRRPRGSGGRRRQHWLTRPEVWFTGLLRIVEPTAMPSLLAGGVGRHCGFGFGMLLLRAP